MPLKSREMSITLTFDAFLLSVKLRPPFLVGFPLMCKIIIGNIVISCNSKLEAYSLRSSTYINLNVVVLIKFENTLKVNEE